MLRLVVFLLAVAALATGLSWLADRPGSLVINWQGYEVETSVFRAIVMLALLVGLSIMVWSIVTQLWRSPALIGAVFNRRRQARGLEALSAGMIAIGSGDRSMATRFADQARRSLPNEPLTHLLRAQAAQLTGDRTTARRIFEAMLGSPETEQLGLRGLFLEAEREGETEAARQFAERAVRLNPKLGWPVDALFDLQCKVGDWDGALDTLAVSKRNQTHPKDVLDRRRAVVLTARAQLLEDTDPQKASALALEAHHLAHDLIPAAAIAGRILAARGNTKRAAHVIERAWKRAPHPDLATAYAYARVGDSPRDRLERVKRLAQINGHSIETPIAIATAAIDARDWDLARRVLEPLADTQQTQRVCTLRARIEGMSHGDKGRVREWLARAVHAPRDAAWTADGIVSDHWAPVSPVTGTLDAFQWRVPVEAKDTLNTEDLARKLEEIVKLGNPEQAKTTAAATGLEVNPGVTSGVDPAADSGADSGAAQMPPKTAAARPAAQQSRSGKLDKAAAVDIVETDRQAATIAVVGAPSPVAARPGGTGSARPPEPAKTAATGPAAETSKGQGPGGKTLDPSMFIAPRAPDDPGVRPDARKPKVQETADAGGGDGAKRTV